MSTAGQNAKYIVTNKKLPWGHKHHHAPEPKHVERPHEQFMLRDELELYDILKNIGMLTMLLSIVILAIGKMTCRAVHCNKGNRVHHIFHKSIAYFLMFNFFY